MSAVIGPIEEIVGQDGLKIPWYMIRFDKRGRLKSPQTLNHLVEALELGDFTHVFLVCHGWNNNWQHAYDRYRGFAKKFIEVRATLDIALPANYKPVLVGVFWPSISLVLPWEKGPVIAGNSASVDGPGLSAEDRAIEGEVDSAIDMFAEDLAEDRLDEYYQLMNSSSLTLKQAGEMAELLASSLGDDDEIGTSADAKDLAAALIASAAQLQGNSPGSSADDEENAGISSAGVVASSPQAAGGLAAIDPRNLIRMATVWKMKDRAGKVGATGVHDMLNTILKNSKASIHVLGHSYGCKVLLSAITQGDLSGKITSALLLQPALSHLAFAVNISGVDRPGGYRAALKRIIQPVMTTFSKNDFALTKIFHLAVRRKSDLGEIKIAATEVPPVKAPSKYAALGGSGPHGMADGEQVNTFLHDSGEQYKELENESLQCIALESSAMIGGHGDVIQAETAWALHEQVRLSL
ncbi:MAG: hypothetical protein V3U76_16965 [Granulosicoccus sp.]